MSEHGTQRWPDGTLVADSPLVWSEAVAHMRVDSRRSVMDDMAELQRARALLRRIEWSADTGWQSLGESIPACPECRGEKPDAPGATESGHKPGCELAALIGKSP